MTDTSIARQTVKGSPMPEHPPWCDKTTCTVATSNSGHHLSRAVNLAPMRQTRWPLRCNLCKVCQLTAFRCPACRL